MRRAAVLLCLACVPLIAQPAGIIAQRLQLLNELLLGATANSGSTGQVLFSQGPGSSPAWSTQLIWDEANARLGVGTLTPQTTLDVGGTVRALGFQLPLGAAAGFVLRSDANGTASWVDPSTLVTASNGLTKVGTDIRLGGTLTAATTIALNGNVLSFAGAGTSTVAVGTASPPGSTARLYVTSNSGSYHALYAVHTSSSTTAAYGALGGEVSGSGYTSARGYVGYHASNNRTFGVRTIGGDYGAWFDRPIAITPGTQAPETLADVEIRNVTAASPPRLLLRRTISATAAGTVLAGVEFGDAWQADAQAQIQVLRGAAASSGSLPTDIVLSTTPVGGTSPVERLRITHQGTVGIGTASPRALLHQDAASGSYHKFTAGSVTGMTSTDGFDVGIAADGTAELRQRENADIRFYTNDQLRMQLLATGELLLHYRLIAQSARRFKESIRSIESPMELVRRLRGVRFRWKAEYGGTADIGFVAEEVAEVVPEIVHRDEAGEVVGLDYTRLVAVLVEALKVQDVRVQQLEQQLESLLRTVEELRCQLPPRR